MFLPSAVVGCGEFEVKRQKPPREMCIGDFQRFGLNPPQPTTIGVAERTNWSAGRAKSLERGRVIAVRGFAAFQVKEW
jgi:hypothetical protein